MPILHSTLRLPSPLMGLSGWQHQNEINDAAIATFFIVAPILTAMNVPFLTNLPSPLQLSNQQQMRDFFKELPQSRTARFALSNWTQSVHISLTLTIFLPYALHFTLPCLELDALSAWMTLDASLECCWISVC